MVKLYGFCLSTVELGYQAHALINNKLIYVLNDEVHQIAGGSKIDHTSKSMVSLAN